MVVTRVIVGKRKRNVQCDKEWKGNPQHKTPYFENGI